MYAAAGGASIARRQDRRKVAKHHVANENVQEQIDKRFAQLQDQYAPGHGAPPGILANASRLPSYLELSGKFGFGSTDVIEGKATSAWTGERRLTSPSEDLERTCKVKQTEAHRRWMKRNRIQDSSYGGGSSSDEEDPLHSGKHHLHIQQQNTLINLLLYIGLCIISLGLIISFVGTGEKGFKTNELRLIGPCLLLIGCIFCGLRVFFCFCRINSKFCMKKSNAQHQKMVKANASKPPKIIGKQMQQTKESSQHHVGLIDDTGNSGLEFYKFLPFHNRTNDFVSEAMTKSSDFDGRKRVSIIPPSKSQSSELNKTLMFSPNQPMPYPIPTLQVPKTVSNTSHFSECSTKKEEQSNLIDLNYSASMHDLLSLSSIEDDMGTDVENVDKISMNSETMKQLISTIITLDNKDSDIPDHSNVISNSCEDLNYNEHNHDIPISTLDFNQIESNDFSLINPDVIKHSFCSNKSNSGDYNKNAIELNQITNHDRIVSLPIVNNEVKNDNGTESRGKNHNISDDSKIEHLKLRTHDLVRTGDLNNEKEPNENSPNEKQSIRISSEVIVNGNEESNESTDKSLRDTIALNETITKDIKQEDKSSLQKPKDIKETKSRSPTIDDTKVLHVVDRYNKSNSVNNNLKTNSIMKDSKMNSNHNKGTKINLLDSKDLKTALNRNNIKNTKSNSASKKVNFTTPNSKNSIELIETHKKYNKSDCISLNESTESILTSNSIQGNEHELVLNPLNLKSTSKS